MYKCRRSREEKSGHPAWALPPNPDLFPPATDAVVMMHTGAPGPPALPPFWSQQVEALSLLGSVAKGVRTQAGEFPGPWNRLGCSVRLSSRQAGRAAVPSAERRGTEESCCGSQGPERGVELLASPLPALFRASGVLQPQLQR